MPGNPFDNMSHERMLQWLDQANAGTVQSAADRLAKAAEEIHKIAEELKIRPQWVEWKGEGADAFRAWTADLANSTLRLGDFSESSAKWLAQASDAIARAQAAIPRDTESAEANRVAAASTPNDPDSDAISSKSSSELAALAADKEKVRQEAAAEMIKLGQAYEFSANQMNALERPKFPPPPEAFVPDRTEDVRGGSVQVGSGASTSGASPVGDPAPLDSAPSRDTTSDVRRSLDAPPRDRVAPLEDAPSTRMGIDSVETLLPDKQTTTGPVSSPPSAGRPDGSGPPSQTGLIPSMPGGGRGVPPGGLPAQGRSGMAGRVPQVPGQVPASPSPARVPGGTGIVGGRPVPPPMGGQTGPIHRGTVVGAPGATGRAPLGPTVGATTPVGRTVGQQGQAPGRRPLAPNGVIGGTPQRTGRVTPGSSGFARTGTTGASTTAGGATRNGVVGGGPNADRSGETRDSGTPRTPRPSSSADTPSRNRQTSRSATDEQNRQPGNGRNVPPVID